MQHYWEKRVCLHYLLVTSITVSNKPRNSLTIFIVHRVTSEKYEKFTIWSFVSKIFKGITIFLVSEVTASAAFWQTLFFWRWIVGFTLQCSRLIGERDFLFLSFCFLFFFCCIIGLLDEVAQTEWMSFFAIKKTKTRKFPTIHTKGDDSNVIVWNSCSLVEVLQSLGFVIYVVLSLLGDPLSW